jgi:hypothetical protein
MASLLQLARGREPRLTDQQHVVALVDGLIAMWDLQPPTSLDVVAGLQGITRIDRAPLPFAACLVPEASGVVIKLRNTDSRARQNFSGFHEVGHTFMPGFELRVQTRCDPGNTQIRDDVEVLCDIAASEFLLPRRHLVPDLRDAELTFAAIQEIAARYDASLEATSLRATALWPTPAMFLNLEVRTKPRDKPGARPCLRVNAFVPRTAAWPAIPRHKSLSPNDALQEVLSNDSFSGRSCLEGLTSGDRQYWVEAAYFPWVDPVGGRLRQRVLAMVTPVHGSKGIRRG